MLVLAVPPMARAVAYADARIAIALLGRARTEELVQRVEHLAQARTGTVDAADAERRRIERDLHDGTQQRLTALAMNLGVARATLPDLSPSAQAALDQAHAEAKEALVELRGIVRGLHPAVLDDRGLDAALSGLAARAPIPVSLDVVVPQRLPRPVEAVAYFVVSEALTNVVKHSGADRAQVTARLVDGRLHLRVVDDGTGGADPTQGSGLVGLRQRVASVDGDLTIESPLGGPTVLEAVIPCAL
jgi:signal transduction histidine kinase